VSSAILRAPGYSIRSSAESERVSERERVREWGSERVSVCECESE
jgi:hypothetical protein